MKKHIFLFILLLLVPCSTLWAQQYVVSSLATPGAATFAADQIKDGVITLPFAANKHTIQIETNQDATVLCDAKWCQASFADKTLTLNVSENTTEEARTAILTVTSKDLRPLLITIRQEARLAFAVISDTHVGNSYGGRYAEKVSNTLQRLTGKGKLDAIAVVGDLTDHGDTDQYTEFVQLFGDNENFVNPVDNFLFMMGNHDNYNSNGQTNYKNGLKKFNSNRSYPLHQYTLIKGYPFITISCLSGANNDDNAANGTASYPSAVVNTLKNYLKKAAEEAPGKPIFVFTHVPPRWTCYSSWGEIEGAAWAMKVLNPVLNQYPQVVIFGGHSHYPLGDPRSIHQGANPNSSRNNYYTSINTASITYSEINPGAVDAGIHPEGFKDVTEGMILVEQPNGDIEIRRYDTYRDEEIDSEHRWVLKAPFDGSQFQYADIRDKNDNPNGVTLRDGLPAPEFKGGAQLTVVPSENDVTVTFPQATDNECVFRYNVRVLKNSQVIKSSFVFSQFYLNRDMPKELSHTVGGLSPKTDYKVEVIAYDSWDNQSAPLTATFTTIDDDRPVPEAVGTWTFDDADNLLAGTGKATLKGAIMEMGSLAIADNLAAVGITPVAGPLEGNGAISVPVNSGLKMTSNLEAQSLSSYTLMFDVRSTELDGYTAIYQNDVTNQTDGSFFIKNGQLGLQSNGLGYNGDLTSGKWHRVVFVVKNNLPTIYLDGRQVGQATSANDSHWQMSTGALFFIDNDGEEHTIEASEIRFWDEALNSKQVLKLGIATGEDVPEPDPLPTAIGTWTFDDATDLMAGTGTATMKATKHAKGNVTVKDNPADANITVVTGPTNDNGAINLPLGSSLMMTSNLNVSSMSTYSILWDVRANDYATFIPLLQNDLTNTKDGSLFINKNMVGLNAGSLGYHGSLMNGNWYRILFVVKNNFATVYVNGVKVGASTSAVQQHWQLTTGALFFADEDGEEKAIETAEIRFWDVALTAEQALQLGEVKTE
ncbi:MAG: metallophosphoesterase [Bacteroidaceae bacterium]|nr:metallophosphoesterase [Bacteroidaceae bacterium]